jgi:hypothetical protein
MIKIDRKHQEEIQEQEVKRRRVMERDEPSTSDSQRQANSPTFIPEATSGEV